MSEINWKELLGWDDAQLEDLRFVGFSYIKQGKYDIALKFFEALSVLDENSVYDIQTLGALYLETGNHLAALDYLERAIKLEPNHANTLINRVKTLFALGYKKQALTQAESLTTHENPSISQEAEALILAYS